MSFRALFAGWLALFVCAAVVAAPQNSETPQPDPEGSLQPLEPPATTRPATIEVRPPDQVSGSTGDRSALPAARDPVVISDPAAPAVDSVEIPPQESGPRPRVALEVALGDDVWGIVVLELFTDHTPKTADNFLKYVEQGYYNGTIFHRVIEDFLVQGGGYSTIDVEKTDGVRDPIPNESKQGVVNLRGTISAARGRRPHTATTQFFFNLVDNDRLDFPKERWGYCAFGRVLSGMEVVDRIGKIEAVRSSIEAAQSQPINPPMIRRAWRLDPGEFPQYPASEAGAPIVGVGAGPVSSASGSGGSSAAAPAASSATDPATPGRRGIRSSSARATTTQPVARTASPTRTPDNRGIRPRDNRGTPERFRPAQQPVRRSDRPGTPPPQPVPEPPVNEPFPEPMPDPDPDEPPPDEPEPESA